jgi:hypothetical protein
MYQNNSRNYSQIPSKLKDQVSLWWNSRILRTTGVRQWLRDRRRIIRWLNISLEHRNRRLNSRRWRGVLSSRVRGRSRLILLCCRSLIMGRSRFRHLRQLVMLCSLVLQLGNQVIRRINRWGMWRVMRVLWFNHLRHLDLISSWVDKTINLNLLYNQANK